MTTLENVEKICAMANISYEEAKAVLEAAHGDLLEAVISLEKQGKIQAPNGGGYFNSEKTADSKEAPPHSNIMPPIVKTRNRNSKLVSFLSCFDIIKQPWEACHSKPDPGISIRLRNEAGKCCTHAYNC